MKELALTESRSGATSIGAGVEGDVAANAFERFDRGMSPNRVVTELVLAVDTVEYLWRTWARFRGMVLLSPDAVRTLRGVLFFNQPIRGGADAEIAVRRFVERPLKQCTRCKTRFPEYCTTCPAQEARKAKKAKRGRRDERSGAASASRPPGFENELLEKALYDAMARSCAYLDKDK